MVGQTHDPLGVLQLFILPTRQLLQRACFSQLGWDQGLNSLLALEHDWDNWFECLPELKNIKLPRYVLPGGKPSSIELHTFSDACVSGYGACAYLRFVCDNRTVFCNLLLGKSRMAPLKPVTKPGL